MKIPCQKCSERATLHITEVTNGGFTEIHLCYKCAQKYLTDAEEPAAPSAKGTALAATASSSLSCPRCKLTFNQFRTTGRLGCPNDYEVFKEDLRPLLENIHDAVKHIGKVPSRLPRDTQVQTKLMQLRQSLQQAVAVEDYEHAARLRDEIEGLERHA